MLILATFPLGGTRQRHLTAAFTEFFFIRPHKDIKIDFRTASGSGLKDGVSVFKGKRSILKHINSKVSFTIRIF